MELSKRENQRIQNVFIRANVSNCRLFAIVLQCCSIHSMLLVLFLVVIWFISQTLVVINALFSNSIVLCVFSVFRMILVCIKPIYFNLRFISFLTKYTGVYFDPETHWNCFVHFPLFFNGFSLFLFHWLLAFGPVWTFLLPLNSLRKRMKEPAIHQY